MSSKLTLIPAALFADAVLGDQPCRLHQIRMIGARSRGWERILFSGGWPGRLAGCVHWILVIVAALLARWPEHRLLLVSYP